MLDPEKLLQDVFIIPEFDNAKVAVTLRAPKGCSRVTWKITDGRKTVSAGKIARPKGKTRFECPMPGFKPWTPESPHLYTLTVCVTAGKETCEVSHAFGMRKFHVAGNTIYLNNRPFYVRGVIRGREAHDHPDLCGLSEYDYYAKYLRAAKRFGFNFVRFHSKVPPRAYFDAADRLGVLTHVEIRKYYGKYQAERDLLDHDPTLVRSRLWTDTIRRIRNHASLMVYCLGNEINQPGRNPEVAERARQLRRLDPTRLFIDTCARGEYDRGHVDLDVQHMGYFAPFGRNVDMFDTSENWAFFGSCKGRAMKTGSPDALTRREVPVNFPVIAHEVCHYVALRDLDALDRKFRRTGAGSPWWVDELRKLRTLKGLDPDYPKLVEASERFQYIWHKQALECVRKSPVLSGFHFLQLADTERYENANGLIDCFDDHKRSVRPEDYLAFNGETVVVADLPGRTFFEGERLTVPVWLSNCSQDFYGDATLTWRLKGESFERKGRLTQIDVKGGLARIATLEIVLPKSAKPQTMTLSITLKPQGGGTGAPPPTEGTAGAPPPTEGTAAAPLQVWRGSCPATMRVAGLPTRHRAGRIVKNAWPLWMYPNRPGTLAIRKATVALSDVTLHKRYPGLAITTDLKKPERLVIADRFTDEVLRHLNRGGDVLMLYRVPETRDRKAKRERYYFPATWDRFKPVIWDRGHNLGAFLRPHAATRGFPNDGFVNFQFARIIDDCDKLSLDDFPVAVSPIVEGVDKASRDRYDVFTFKLRELQPGWTMRRFAYLLDLAAGKGRLMLCGFNLTGLERDVPEACAMFESLARCITSKSWQPKAHISVDALRRWLAKMGRAPRIKERMMTQYWQLDAEPLESAQYWKDAEAWIRKR